MSLQILGRHKYYEHVKSYKLAFSKDGNSWSFYQTDGEDKVRLAAVFIICSREKGTSAENQHIFLLIPRLVLK